MAKIYTPGFRKDAELASRILGFKKSKARIVRFVEK